MTWKHVSCQFVLLKKSKYVYVSELCVLLLALHSYLIIFFACTNQWKVCHELCLVLLFTIFFFIVRRDSGVFVMELIRDYDGDKTIMFKPVSLFFCKPFLYPVIMVYWFLPF